MRTRTLKTVLSVILTLIMSFYPMAGAAPDDGETQDVQEWAYNVAATLYRATVAVAIIGFFGALLAVGIAYTIPHPHIRSTLVHFGGTSLMGALISIIVVMTVKSLAVTIVRFIDPNAADQLATAFNQITGMGG